MDRNAVASLAAAACLLIVTACDSQDPQSTPQTSTPGVSTTSSNTSTGPSTPFVPAYLVKYSEEEREAFDAAVDDYAAFSDRNAEFFRVGKATPTAKAYYVSATSAWQSYWAKLLNFESRGLRVIGRGEVIRVRPASIRVDPDGGGQVDLAVCGVSKGVTVLQDGQVVPQPTPRPTITRVRMVKLPGEASWRTLFDRVGSPC